MPNNLCYGCIGFKLLYSCQVFNSKENECPCTRCLLKTTCKEGCKLRSNWDLKNWKIKLESLENEQII